MELLYYLMCVLAVMIIGIIIGASYVPPWELFRHPLQPPYIYALVAIIFIGVFGGSLLYTDNELKKWVFDMLFQR